MADRYGLSYPPHKYLRLLIKIDLLTTNPSVDVWGKPKDEINSAAAEVGLNQHFGKTEKLSSVKPKGPQFRQGLLKYNEGALGSLFTP